MNFHKWLRHRIISAAMTAGESSTFDANPTSSNHNALLTEQIHTADIDTSWYLPIRHRVNKPPRVCLSIRIARLRSYGDSRFIRLSTTVRLRLLVLLTVFRHQIDWTNSTSVEKRVTYKQLIQFNQIDLCRYFPLGWDTSYLRCSKRDHKRPAGRAELK